jgi:hypothetical protein
MYAEKYDCIQNIRQFRNFLWVEDGYLYLHGGLKFRVLKLLFFTNDLNLSISFFNHTGIG